MIVSKYLICKYIFDIFDEMVYVVMYRRRCN